MSALRCSSLLGLWLGALGCAAQPVRTAQLPLRAVEVTEDGRELEIPNTGVTDIDINSVVELRLNEPVLRPAMQQAGGVDPAALVRLQQRTAKIGLALDAERTALAGVLAQLSQPAAPDQRQRAALELGKLEERALDALTALYPSDQVEGFLGAGVLAGYAQASAALEREIATNDLEIARIDAQLQAIRFRVLATLQTDDGPIAQHLDGYDSFSDGAPRVVQKLAWALPEDLQAQIDAARATALRLQDLKGLELELRKLLEQRAYELLDRLAAAGRALLALQDSERAWRSAAWKAAGAAKPLLRAAAALLHEAEPIGQACASVWAELPAMRGLSAAHAIARLSDSSSALRGCIGAIVDRAAGLQSASGALAEAAEALVHAAESDLALAQQLSAQSLAEIRAALELLRAESFASLAEFWSGIQAAFLGASGVIDAPMPRAAPETIDRPYGSLQDTKIDLTRSARAVGDTLYWRAAVIEAGNESRAWSGPTLRIVSSGAHLDVSAAVLFVKPFRAQLQDGSFPAAAAVTAALHYNIPRNSGENSYGGVWNFLNPGLGLHLAYLDLGATTLDARGERLSDDPQNEIGVGGIVQLFGDALEAGVGYDLQAARAYWFIGIGLQTLTKLGITVPGGPSRGQH